MASSPSKNGVGFVAPSNAPSLANYPHMRRCGGMVYVSGLSSRRPDGTHVGAERGEDGEWKLDIAAQTRAVIENMRRILQLDGRDLSHVVDLTVFLTDMSNYKGMNDVYNEFFDAKTGPTRTCVAVHQLPHPNLLVEIKAIASE